MARFRTALTDVARWELQVIDSAGRVAMVFAGRDTPPAEIAWDGRRVDGRPASCGLTYSYVMEAYDRAGNKRRIVGDGFELPAYRLDGPSGPVLLTAGDHWTDGAAADLALEAASRLNLATAPTAPLTLTVLARTQVQADDLGRYATALIEPLLTGAPGRISLRCEIAPEAPAVGALQLAPVATP